jgi:hypothetical protein
MWLTQWLVSSEELDIGTDAEMAIRSPLVSVEVLWLSQYVLSVVHPLEDAIIKPLMV